MPAVEHRLEPDSCSERKHFGDVGQTSILSSPGTDPTDSYRPRNPEQSVLYRTVAGNLETFMLGGGPQGHEPLHNGHHCDIPGPRRI